MIEHVLVPMDESPLAEQALDHALETYPDARITVLRVIDYVEESYGAEMLVGPEKLRERAEAQAEELFADAQELAAAADADLRTELRYGEPARTILEYVEAADVDLIVLGSHGRSLMSRVLLGDTAHRVIERAPVPVTVVR